MTNYDNHLSDDGEDKPFSHWEDFKQRLIASLWHDYFKRTTLIASVVVFVGSALWLIIVGE